MDDLTHDGKISKTLINKKKSIDRSKGLTQKEQAEYYVSQCKGSDVSDISIFHIE